MIKNEAFFWIRRYVGMVVGALIRRHGEEGSKVIAVPCHPVFGFRSVTAVFEFGTVGQVSGGCYDTQKLPIGGGLGRVRRQSSK